MNRLLAGGHAADATPRWLWRLVLAGLDALAVGCGLVAAAGVSIGLHGDTAPSPEVAAMVAPLPVCFAEPGSDMAPFFCAAAAPDRAAAAVGAAPVVGALSAAREHRAC